MQIAAKKPLVSEEDVRKMKEEENKKLAAVTASFPIAVEEYIDDDLSFEHILNNKLVVQKHTHLHFTDPLSQADRLQYGEMAALIEASISPHLSIYSIILVQFTPAAATF